LTSFVSSHGSMSASPFFIIELKGIELTSDSCVQILSVQGFELRIRLRLCFRRIWERSLRTSEFTPSHLPSHLPSQLPFHLPSIDPTLSLTVYVHHFLKGNPKLISFRFVRSSFSTGSALCFSQQLSSLLDSVYIKSSRISQ